MSVQRDHYRVRTRRRSMKLCVCAPHGEFRGLVDDLSVRGCSAALGRAPKDGAWPDLVVGERVRLEFAALLLLEPLRAEAVVRGVRGTPEGLRVGFEFADVAAVQSQVPYVLLAEFNRRESPRVIFENVIEVRLHGRDSDHLALLLDLSAGGMGLRVTPLLARRLTLGDALQLRFTLPECEDPFQLAARVRDQYAEGEFARLSVQFDARATVNHEAQMSALERIVESRAQGTILGRVSIDPPDSEASARPSGTSAA